MCARLAIRPAGNALRGRYRSTLARMLNPFVDLAAVASEDQLASSIVSYTNSFGLVSALVLALTSAALTNLPTEDNDKTNREMAADLTPRSAQQQQLSKRDNQPQQQQDPKDSVAGNIPAISLPHAPTAGPPNSLALSGSLASTTTRGASVLVACGVPKGYLGDAYVASMVASAYSAMGGLGLATVNMAWLTMTPPGGVKAFVLRNSRMLCAVPFLSSISVSLVGLSIFLHLDAHKGQPLSYIALGGTVLVGGMVVVATLRNVVGTHRLLLSAIANKVKHKI